MSATLTKMRHLPLVLGVIATLIAGGIGYGAIAKRPTPPLISETPPQVKTVSALGRLEPQGEVIQVFAPTSAEGARVEIIRVTHGQQIRKGDVIAVLDSYARRLAAFQEAQEQVRVAQAQLSQVEAGAKAGQIRAQARVVDRQQVELQTETEAQAATIARLQAELHNAALEARRYQVLYSEGAVSASLRDGKQLTADTVRQQLNEAQVNLSRIQRSRQQQVSEAQATLDQIAEVRPVDVNVARSQVSAAQARVARAKAELDLATVRSPQDGQVLKIHTRPGELVGEQGIISLGQTRQMVAVAEVYELDVSRIRAGQTATVISKNNAFPDVLRGQVVEVGLEINKQDVLNTDPAAQFDARVVEVKVRLDAASSRRVAGLTNLSVQVSIDVN
ncbi:ABC exporter membrane fusion protein [Leptolyngbya sp. FACHB-321]|uniref:ABC exporter membrane fusion protein n=1 Tax=Leptolyngbya sp. FACHB-321 TaxID=2692807 RepID=UPI00168212D6|nr:ABC exporter membrane fusion protein [Leptolyngbya sp. FACHB-321]MBD2038572.1 ABC exporter membrane fusion protein [Leptolyngbya sp. FACHB-321]